MIGWKCQYGYFERSINPTQITAFHVTDENGIFALPQQMDLPVDTNNVPVSSAYATYVRSADNQFVMAQILAGSMSVEYNFVYGVPYRGAQDLAHYNDLTIYFPSFKLMCPNLWYLSDSGSLPTPYVGCFIPALNRYIVQENSSGQYAEIYNALNASPLNSRGVGPIPYSYNAAPRAWAYLGAVDQVSLANVENYKCVNVIWNPNSYSKKPVYYCNGFTNSDSSNARDWFRNVLVALFGEYSPPDAQIGGNGDDPYGPGGNSGEGDLPPGTFDDDSDPIEDSPLPTISAANTGFTRIYNPTLSQVQNLARYLWTDENVVVTIWNHLKQFFEDPMQAMIGFNLVPCKVPDGGIENFTLMYIPTDVYMTVAANQFVDVDCGTLQLERYYGSALDQSPYTKVIAYLPYIGQVQLDTDEVMGTTLQVKYRIDIVSGSCVAKILVDGSVLYQYSGHCAITIPFSSGDFSQYVSAAINVAKLAITAATAGTAGTVEEITTTAVETTTTERNPNTGRQVTSGTQKYNETQTVSKPAFRGISPSNISNTVASVMGAKAVVQHSGSFSGNSGYLGVRRPYLIIERPNMCLPTNYQSLNGYPSMITMPLGECQGFTRVQQVQLTGLWATNPEQDEILQLLKTGVVF